MSLDRISLLGLRAFGRHGVLEHERAVGQEFVIDAVLGIDTRPAAATDDLALTADYGALANRLAAIVAGPPVDLIETLAQRLATACLDDPAVAEVQITVHKPHAPVAQHVADVSVTITPEPAVTPGRRRAGRAARGRPVAGQQPRRPAGQPAPRRRPAVRRRAAGLRGRLRRVRDRPGRRAAPG